MTRAYPDLCHHQAEVAPLAFVYYVSIVQVQLHWLLPVSQNQLGDVQKEPQSKPGMLWDNRNPNIWEVEGEGSEAQGIFSSIVSSRLAWAI